MPADVSLTGWWIGYAIAAVVVVIVVVVVGTIILLGTRIRDQARTITDVLDRTKANTDALWGVQQTNVRLANIVEGTRRARRELGG